MLDQMRMNGKPDPEFIEQNEFSVTFRKEAVVEQEEPSAPSEQPIGSGQFVESVAQRYRLALEYISQHGSMCC